jgi:hypothetical protein
MRDQNSVPEQAVSKKVFNHLPNFEMHKNLLAFLTKLDGLDCYNENFVVNDHISSVAQLQDVGIYKPTQEMILDKLFH